MEVLSETVRLFHRGGLVMYPLLLCSVVVVAVAIERYRFFHYRTKDVNTTLAELRQQIADGRWEVACAACCRGSGSLARVMAAGLRYRNDVNVMRDTFESMVALEAAGMRKHLGYLDTVITLAPLLGLLGTVVGMISTFSVLDLSESNPGQVTGGVGEALVATAAGLCVAVLALAVYSYFQHRLEAQITDLETACIFVCETAKGDCT